MSSASREPTSNATAMRLRQIASRQQRLRLTQPARPVLQSRWRRTLAWFIRNLVKLLARVDWAKVIAAATAITAVFALIISASSLRSTQKQYSLSERGQLSDRFNKAIGELDSKNNTKEVMAGGIYSLEQLTHDPSADKNLRIAVFDELNAYLANNARQCPKPAPPPVDVPAPAPVDVLSPPDVDVQAALAVIGRRDADKFREAQEQIDLSSVCLSGADLREALLENARLWSTTLTQATLAGANLAFANLSYAVLKNAYLGKSDKGRETNLKQATLVNARLNYATLTDADLTDATLTGANLTRAHLTGAHLTGAHLTGANLTGANLTGANLTGTNLNNICYESPPRWPDGFIPPPSASLKCASSLNLPGSMA
jgi:uncharacterized protein YjbI with pentapeptide repeats